MNARGHRDSVVNIFNKDVKSRGSYLYTNPDVYSSYIANKHLTNETLDILRKYFSRSVRLIDVGCGDGIYTLEIYKRFRPASILGFDPLANAIQKAKTTNKDFKNLSFEKGNIYTMHKKLSGKHYDLAITRGVLHHLEHPQKGIKSLCKSTNNVLILEPNGYNPLLKIIEKFSPYHKIHQEKSYSPHALNIWFGNQGFRISDQKFFNIVPYFCPKPLAIFLKKIEPIIERLPLLRTIFCSVNMVLYTKTDD